MEKKVLDIGGEFFDSEEVNPFDYRYQKVLPDVNIDDGGPSAFEYAKAVIGSAPVYKAGVGSALFVDEIKRQFRDPNDPLFKVDPRFNALDVFKSGGHSEHEFDNIISMTNYEQYARYMEVVNFNKQNAKTISESGLSGAAGSILFNIATDPTVYAGFGFAKMLKAGTSYATASAVSAAGAAIAFEGLEQVGDPQRTVAETALNIGGSALFGAVLGGGVDVFSKLANRGVLKKNRWDESTKQWTADASDIEARSLSAAATMYNPESPIYALNPQRAAEGSEIDGFFARAFGKAIAPFSPKLRMQTASSPETRELGEQLMGLSAKNKLTAEGVAAQPSMLDYYEDERGFFTKFFYETQQITSAAEKKLGRKITPEEFEEIMVLSNSSSNNLLKLKSSGVYKNHIIDLAFHRKEHYRKAAERFKDMPGFEQRFDYGGPAIFNSRRISSNMEEFIDLRYNDLVKVARRAEKNLKTVQKNIDKLNKELKIAKAAKKGLESYKLERKIAQLEEDAEFLRFMDFEFQGMKDGEISQSLRDIAIDDATNRTLGKKDVMITGSSGKKINPRFWNQRTLNVKKYRKFLEIDPRVQAQNYFNDTAPFYAEYKVFGEMGGIEGVINNYNTRMKQKYSDLLRKGDKKAAAKIEGEMRSAESNARNFWDTMIGVYQRRAYDQLGQYADVVNASADMARISTLVNPVLASLVEPLAIGLHHGLKGQAKFLRDIQKFTASPEFRKIAKSQAAILSNGLKVITNNEVFEALSREAAEKAITSGISQKTSALSRMYFGFTGINHMEDIIRSALAVTQDEFLSDSVINLAKGGKNLTKDQVSDIAFLGINKKSAKVIARQIEKYSEKVKLSDDAYIYLSNFQKWDDQGAAEIYRMALRRDSRRTSLEPGIGDVPYITKSPIGKALFMFRGWGIAASQKYFLSTLQRKDASILMAATNMVGLGMLVELTARAAAGKDDPEEYDFDELLFAGINRSGIAGILPDFGGNYVASKLFDINTGIGRIYDYNTLPDLVIGPVGSYAGNVVEIVGFPFEEMDRFREEKNPRNPLSISDEVIRTLPIPVFKPFFIEQAKSLQE